MRALPHPPLLVITDRVQARQPLEEIARAVFDAGGRWLSLREKDMAPVERTALLVRLITIAAPYKAAVMVHEDIEAALKTGAAGVHLPAGSNVAAARARLGDGVLIGLSCHAGDKPLNADYATLSPIFPTASKPGYGPALDLEGLAAAAKASPVPLLALGGLNNPARLKDCRQAGASGAAMMGEIMCAEDPGAVMKALLAAWKRTA